MSSLTSNPNMTPSEILSLNLNDSALDLLNAAIASHQVKLKQDEQQQDNLNNNNNNNNNGNVTTEDEATNVSPSNTHAHTKRELDKDEQTVTAPKRAGRKPLDKSQTADASLDPKQKRKAQNRAAQRAFRDRKEKHVAELQARIDELEAQNATKDENLVKENAKLKEMLKKLQEENYALKGAQFTFEFPVNTNNNNSEQHHDTTTTTTTTTTSTISTNNDINNLYHKNTTTTSGSSSMSSGNSYSGEDISSSSAEHSPLSNSHTHEDDSTSAETPITTANLFSTEPMQFGLIQLPSSTNSLDFLAVSDNTNNFGLGNGLSTSQNFPTSNNNNFAQVDLFHGKDDLFTNYRVPPPSSTTEDFLFANEDLSSLFGGNNELFGFNNNQFSFNAQFGLPETPATLKRQNNNSCTPEKRQQLLEKLKRGQQEGKHIYQVHQEIQAACPDFNLDALCDELKKKATCSMSQYPLTDYDVDAFVKCLDRV